MTTSESPTHPDAPRARRRTLKVYPEYFDALESGAKSFEFRKDDREPRYAVGDTLVLREWNPMVDRDEFMGDFTGRECLRRVTYVARGRFIPEGFCVMSIVPLRPDAPRAGGETPTAAEVDDALLVAMRCLELYGGGLERHQANVLRALRSALASALPGMGKDSEEVLNLRWRLTLAKSSLECYGRHHPWCASLDAADHEWECDCGLQNLLNESSAARAAQPEETSADD